MHTGKGQVVELILVDGSRYLRLACRPELIPAAGQYLLAGDGADAPLPVPLFHTDSASNGFIAAAPEAPAWSPGRELHLRGPLGRGFSLPLSARRVGLIAFDVPPVRLRGLIGPALQQDAAVVLVCNPTPEHLPVDVEVQPRSGMPEILDWADYLAFEVRREGLNQLRERVNTLNRLPAGNTAQVVIHTPVPCGGIADCGTCAISLKSAWKLACKDGPVFDWGEL